MYGNDIIIISHHYYYQFNVHISIIPFARLLPSGLSTCDRRRHHHRRRHRRRCCCCGYFLVGCVYHHHSSLVVPTIMPTITTTSGRIINRTVSLYNHHHHHHHHHHQPTHRYARARASSPIHVSADWSTLSSNRFSLLQANIQVVHTRNNNNDERCTFASNQLRYCMDGIDQLNWKTHINKKKKEDMTISQSFPHSHTCM